MADRSGSLPELEPIEPHLRSEPPPDDAIVVVRGGPIAAEKLLEHLLRQAREYSHEGAPMYSVSVSLVIDAWSLDQLLAGPLASRSTYAASTAGRLRRSGYRLLPTYAPPHYDLLLPDGSYHEAELLLAHFGPPQPNPNKRRRR